MGGGEGNRGSVDTVGKGSSSMVDSMVGDRGGVDKRSSMVDGMVGHWMVDHWVVDGMRDVAMVDPMVGGHDGAGGGRGKEGGG